MANKKAEILTMDGQVVSPITLATNVLLDEGRTAQDLLDSRDESMFSPTIATSSSMSKVGQGDSVDYSENVVDGAYESCVLKGNTKVNLIQESSSQDVVLPYEFAEGQSVTISDTKESGALGVELKGQTLVNLANLFSFDDDVTTSSYFIDKTVCETSKLQVDKPYLICFKPTVKENLNTGNYVQLQLGLGNSKNMTVAHPIVAEDSYTYNINHNEWNFIKVTFKDFRGYQYLTVRPLRTMSPSDDKPITYNVNKGFMLLEYQDGMENWDIPYFEGMQSVRVPSVTTVGKNLFDGDTFKQNAKKIPTYTINGSILKWQNSGVSQNYTLIEGIFKKETKYTFSLRSGSSNNVNLYVCYTDGTKKWFNGNLTTESNKTIEKITPVHSDGSYTTLDINDFQIEESTTPTTYEPYKSTTLTLPEEITLRGIGNVKDTLNTVTGEYTQRIGEVVLDGSITELEWHYAPDNNTFRTSFIKHGISEFTGKTKIFVVSDKYASRDYASSWNEGRFVSMDMNQNVVFRDERFTKNSEWVIFLSQNPITVQYELATPITKKLDLTFTNQDNAPTTKLSTYNTTTHINTSSQEGSLIPILSHSNPSYPVILKPSTKYSIVADSYSNDHTNSAINFNLGGATVSTIVGNRVTTITTPSTLTSEKLVMSGRGNMLNNVMVIEGDVVGDEPYFEGMCDVKSYVTLENLATSFSLINSPHNDIIYHVDFNGKERLESGKTYTMWSRIGGTVQLEIGSSLITINNVTTKVKFTINGSVGKFRFYRTSYDNIFSEQGGEGLLKDLVIIEGNYTNWNIPYFEGTANIQRPMVKNVGKNLFDKSTFLTNCGFKETASGYVGSISNLSGKRYSIKYRNNTVYTITIEGSSEKSLIHYLVFAYTDGTTSGYTNILPKQGERKSFTSMSGKTLSSFYITYSNTDIYTFHSFQLEEGKQATTYEPYKSNILSCNSEVALRSLPNGVCDTLDLMTGEYVQRIGEIVLDGSEDEVWGTSVERDSKIVFYTLLTDCKYSNYVVQTDKFPTNAISDVWGANSIEGAYVNDAKSLLIAVLKTKLSSNNVVGIRQYLQSNPITVQYELATPIVSTIDVQGFPYAYENGHVILSSGSIEQSLTPTIEYSLIANRLGQIQTNQKLVEKQQAQIDELESMVVANLVNTQYQQALNEIKLGVK